ncbi:MAG: peptide chain release factor N(5)-glutamine methyltransferase [Peptococcales bacterium]|jgi:release factor glutamine methyltransferase
MKDLNRPQTVKELLQWAVLFLGNDRRMEAELLLTKVSGLTRAKLLAYPEIIIESSQVQYFQELVTLRHKGEPLQYLLGTQSFMGLDFLVNENVLIPRSDTEVLVEETLNLAREIEEPLKILDLCTGSGAIAVSVAQYLDKAEVIGIDISEEALNIAKINAQRNNLSKKVKFIHGDLFTPLGQEKFHIIISNPPYVSTEEMANLPEDVKKEPALALWGGEDGLDFYRAIIGKSSKFLISPGWLLVEIGWQQGPAVKQLFEKNGFSHCQIIKDWSGHDRVVKGCFRGPLAQEKTN